MSDHRIVIVGFMGCGKTTVAEALARGLACDYIDLDWFVTTRESRSPADIIRNDGEPSFREIEARALREVVREDIDRVIALGGGTWTVEANRNLLHEQNYSSVWLDAPFELCWERIQSGSDEVRPLAPDRDTTERLYESRRGDYALASVRILVGESDTPESLASEILAHTSKPAGNS